MTICFFGNYLSDYSRVNVLRQGLQQNNVKILECHTRQHGLKKYLALYQQHQKIKNQYDILIVMLGGYTLVWFAKLLTHKKVIFDAFVSLYLTNYYDRGLYKKNSWQAIKDRFLDKWACQLADKIILDTQAQIDYFVKNYQLNPSKFQRIFVGAEDTIFKPQKTTCSTNKFVAHWQGFIVPHHGLETIISAADILKNNPQIEFLITTRFDKKFEKIKQKIDELKLTNIKLSPPVKISQLADQINSVDVCLGVFSNNKKAQVVITNKIFEAVACAKPAITARHKVISEIFTDRENIILVEPNNPQDLANKILELANNPEFKNKISQNAYNLYLKKLTPRILGKQLYDLLGKIL